jgi:hypothetical protein
MSRLKKTVSDLKSYLQRKSCDFIQAKVCDRYLESKHGNIVLDKYKLVEGDGLIRNIEPRMILDSVEGGNIFFSDPATECHLTPYI